MKKKQIQVSLFKKFKPFVLERLLLIVFLWAAIAFIAYLLPSILGFVMDKQMPSILDLTKFADIKLIVLLMLGALIASGALSNVFANINKTKSDESNYWRITSALWDEVSSASTHFACANLMVIVCEKKVEIDTSSLIWILLFFMIGWMAFYNKEADPKEREDGQPNTAQEEGP